jgi:hypothetical protein
MINAWRFLTVLAAALLAVTLVAGCGDDDNSADEPATTAGADDAGDEEGSGDAGEEAEGEPLSRDEYADEICSRVEDGALRVDFPPLLNNFGEIAQLADEQRDEVSGNFEELDALQPPEDLEEVHEQILDDVDLLLESTEEVGDAAKAQDEAALGDAYDKLRAFTTGEDAAAFIDEECAAPA